MCLVGTGFFQLIGPTMDSTMTAATSPSLDPVAKTAVQNSHKSAIKSVNMWMLWAAVAIPMLWGILKALQEVNFLFQ
jgi:hypothetical protein